jgi:hypothetical protein
MTNTERITANNAKLHETIEMAETLPDAPSEILSITENGMHNVESYYIVDVNVADKGEGIAALLDNSMEELNNDIVTTLRTRACQGATGLQKVYLPKVVSVGTYAFYGCTGLVTITLPKLTTLSSQPFYSCSKLVHADCGQVNSIPAQAFNACTALTELILRKTSSICTLANVSGVNNTPIGKGTGYVYVPSILIDTYKTATNWSTFADQFRAIEDYPDICG